MLLTMTLSIYVFEEYNTISIKTIITQAHSHICKGYDNICDSSLIVNVRKLAKVPLLVVGFCSKYLLYLNH